MEKFLFSTLSLCGKMLEPEVEFVLNVLISQLFDVESFVYLSALQAIGEVANYNIKYVFSTVLRYFAGEIVFHIQDSHLRNLTAANQKIRVRILLGEAVGNIFRHAGDFAAVLAPPLIAACLKIVRSRPTTRDAKNIETHVDLQGMKIRRTKVSNDNSLLGEEELHNAQPSMDMDPDTNPEFRDAGLSADAVLLRQSALSLLGDAMGKCGWAVEKYTCDLVEVASGILVLESGREFTGLSHQSMTKYLQASANIRRYVYH
jgi:hypothetical protein